MWVLFFCSEPSFCEKHTLHRQIKSFKSASGRDGGRLWDDVGAQTGQQF